MSQQPGMSVIDKTTHRAIVKTDSTETTALCRKAGFDTNVVMTIHSEIADFLLDLQNDSYDLSLFDCHKLGRACLQWVTFIRRMRPKMPLIVICDEVDQHNGARMYEEKVFYIAQRPIDEAAFFEVLTASLKCTVA